MNDKKQKRNADVYLDWLYDYVDGLMTAGKFDELDSFIVMFSMDSDFDILIGEPTSQEQITTPILVLPKD